MTKRQTIIELSVVVVIIVVLVIVLVPMRLCARDENLKLRCASSLQCLGTAVNMYLTGIGKGVWYPQPASVFYGDTWLLALYWEDIVKEPKVFICPATSDDWTKIAKLTPKKYDVAITADAVSYAGRSFGLTKNTWRNSTDFSKAGMASASMMACDDNQGNDHHSDGLNAVFFDSHVEFIANCTAISAYHQVGARGTKWPLGTNEFEKMDSGGWEPPQPSISLNEAAETGDIVKAGALIAMGADVNSKDKNRLTPLHFAAACGHRDIAELLIAHGAALHAKARYDKTPLHMAVEESNEDVAKLLIAKGADVNAKDQWGRTPLHYAVLNMNKDIVRLLIAKGADVNAKDKDGNVPLSLPIHAWSQ